MKLRSTRLAALVAACVLLLAGCAPGSGTAWVYEKDGQRMPAGVYLSYQVTALGDAQSQLLQENMTDANFVMPTDLAGLLKSTVGGKNTAQFVNEKAAAYSQRYYAVEQRFDALGLTWDEDQQAVADYVTDSTWAQNGAVLEKSGIAKSSLALRTVNDLKMQRVFETLYGPGGEREIPEAEIRDELGQNYLNVLFYSMRKPTEIPEGYAGTLEAYAAEQKAKLEALLPRLQGGETLPDLVYEYEQEQYKALGLDASMATKPTEAQLSLFITKEETPYYLPEFIAAIQAATPEVPTVFELDTSYFLVIRRDLLADENYLIAYRDTVVENLKFDEFTAELIAEGAALNLTVNQKAINRYQPSKLDAALLATAA